MLQNDDMPDATELGRSYQQALNRQPPRDDANQGSAAEGQSPGPPPTLTRILEALLFVGGAPLTIGLAEEIIRGLTREQFDAALDGLNQDYRRQGRPYSIGQQGDGFASSSSRVFARSMKSSMVQPENRDCPPPRWMCCRWSPTASPPPNPRSTACAVRSPAPSCAVGAARSCFHREAGRRSGARSFVWHDTAVSGFIWIEQSG